jgi:hypothetical protein
MLSRCIPAVARNFAFLFALLVSACGGGGGGGGSNPIPPGPGLTTYTVGGTVSGMVGTGLVLTNNGDNLTMNANGGFTFSTAWPSGFTYSVAVQTQPSSPAQLCTVANGGGTISGNVTNVQVVCRNTIGGTVTGLVGTLVLRNNGGDDKTINASGPFTFATAINTGTGYSVTVFSSTNPAQQCTVTNGSGTANNGNVTNVQVVCRNTIGGTVSGLTGTVVLQNNGGDNLSVSANGPFTFATALDTANNSYSVTVFTQPTGQTCLVTANRSGVAFGNVTNVEVSCVNGQWTWMGGSSTANQLGVYGTKGTAAPGNIPGGRYGHIAWTDSASGNLWLFGGFGYDSVPPTISLGDLNDLWKYNIALGQWTWVSGANTQNQIGVYGTKGIANINNVPGARESSVSWIDAGGNLWLFGGFGRDSMGVYGELNDLWKFTVGTGLWTWVSGSNKDDNLSVAPVYGTKGTAGATNVPGGRRNGVSWTDASGNLWLFGGYSWDSTNNIGPLNDLWKFNIASGQWTWMSGPNVGRQSGTYGVQGTANAANVPGARESAMGWFDAAGGNLWLFGGNGYDSSTSTSTNNLNDLWKYNIALGQWTWVSGSNLGGQGATYGTLGVASAGNVPGARNMATGQIDSGGNLWLFAGSGGLSDLWKFNIAGGQWTWMNGSKFANDPGKYGTLSVAGTSIPGARQASVSWIDSGGNQWFFGGYNGGHLNDLWRFK